jgi:hypothetical protein
MKQRIRDFTWNSNRLFVLFELKSYCMGERDTVPYERNIETPCVVRSTERRSFNMITYEY